MRLEMKFAEKSTKDVHDLDYLQHSIMPIDTEHEHRELLDVERVFRKIMRDHTYLVAVALSDNYFENGVNIKDDQPTRVRFATKLLQEALTGKFDF